MVMWQVGVTASVAVAGVYLGIAAVTLRPLLRQGRFGSSRLWTATGVAFLTGAIGHAGYALALWDDYSVPVVVWEFLTAGVGVAYLSVRRTDAALMRGAQRREDTRERHRQALEINDNIVQGLYVAQAALALNERELSEEALRDTLAAARQIISGLLVGTDTELVLGPGELVRQAPAVVAAVDVP